MTEFYNKTDSARFVEVLAKDMCDCEQCRYLYSYSHPERSCNNRAAYQGFQKEGFSNIFVIDGNSKDNTGKIAEAEGAKVEMQTGRGKGQAMIQAFNLIENPYIIMVDGDGTYLARDAPALLEPILEGKADHVIGNRLEKYSPGAFTKLNLMGNN